MRESDLSAKMAKRVRDRGGWCRKVASGPYGAGWPDLVGCHCNMFLGLEVKLPGKENTLTDLQRATLADLRSAGAVACMVTSMKQLDYVLDCMERAHPATKFTASSLLVVEARTRVRERRARDAQTPASAVTVDGRCASELKVGGR